MDDVTVAIQVDLAMRAAKLDLATAPEKFPAEFQVEGFCIQQLVGSGGQGSVYKATQRSTGKAVAIKVLLDGRFAESRTRRRFEREAEALSKLNHPNVISIIDQGRTSNGAHYLAMPFVEGRTFESLLVDESVERDERLDILVKIARAVHACHQAGIVHRDLKPSNILIDEYGHPHVLDFGMARPVAETWSEITLQGCDVGTLLWASPEQLQGRGDNVSPAMDIYALGVMLYQCLADGRHPFPLDESLSETLRRILETTPARPCGSSQLNEVVARAMSKRAHDRYPTALKLAEAVETPHSLWLSRRLLKRFWTAATMLFFAVTAIFLIWWIGTPAHEDQATTGVMQPLPVLINSAGMKFLKIPAGHFQMGTRNDAPTHADNEPLHMAVIDKSFWISETETTFGQWRNVMTTASIAGEANLPVANISHDDVDLFCKRLGEMDGRHYRLPTENEWEYAARAGTRMPFGWSNSPSTVAWYADNSRGRTHPVMQLASNGWGLYDMAGNVAEMCSDADAQAAAAGISRFSLRGGSFSDSASDCTVSHRRWIVMGARSESIGFRIVFDGP